MIQKSLENKVRITLDSGIEYGSSFDRHELCMTIENSNIYGARYSLSCCQYSYQNLTLDELKGLHSFIDEIIRYPVPTPMIK